MVKPTFKCKIVSGKAGHSPASSGQCAFIWLWIEKQSEGEQKSVNKHWNKVDNQKFNLIAI